MGAATRGSPLKSVLPGERLIARGPTSTGPGNDFSLGFPRGAGGPKREEGRLDGRAPAGPATAQGPRAGGGRAEAHTGRRGAPFPARRSRAPPPPAPPGPFFPTGTAGRADLPHPAQRRALRLPAPATSRLRACSPSLRAAGQPPRAAPPRPRRARGAPGQWGRGGCCSGPRGSVCAAPWCRPASEAPDQVSVGPELPSGPVPQPRASAGPRGYPLTAPSPGARCGLGPDLSAPTSGACRVWEVDEEGSG